MHAPFPLSANISILFKEVPLLERPARARAAGFSHIESWWPFDTAEPALADVDAFVTAVEDASVTLTGLNVYAGDMPGGERGVACLPERRGEFDRSLPILRSIAERTGVRQFNCLFGQYRDDLADQVQAAAAVSAIAAAVEAVADLGGTILLEPLARGLNGAYPLLSVDDVLGVIDGPLAAAGVTRVGLLFDTFHLGSNSDDVLADARRVGQRIAHVQIADVPGRHEPGTGSLPIAQILAVLAEAGYDGFVGCEYVPVGSTEEGLGWAELTSGTKEESA